MSIATLSVDLAANVALLQQNMDNARKVANAGAAQINADLSQIRDQAIDAAATASKRLREQIDTLSEVEAKQLKDIRDSGRAAAQAFYEAAAAKRHMADVALKNGSDWSGVAMTTARAGVEVANARLASLVAETNSAIAASGLAATKSVTGLAISERDLAHVLASIETPAEQQAKTLAKINALFEAGALSINQYHRAYEVAQNQQKKIQAEQSRITSSFSLGNFYGVGAVVAGAATGGEFVGILEEFDRLNASLKTVTGSEQAAAAAMAMLSKFSVETPYELSQVTEAFIKLKSLGLDASEQALRDYGNTASAMGKPIMQYIEAVADASTNEFERLKEFGIKAAQENDKVTFTFKGVSTTIQKESGAIVAYLRNLAQTNFSTGMADQMDTIGGKLSNLKDAFSNFAVFLGNLGITNILKHEFESITTFIQQFQTQLDGAFGDGLDSQVNALKASLSEMHRIYGQMLALRKLPGGNFLIDDADLAERQKAMSDMSKSLIDLLGQQRAAREAQQQLLNQSQPQASAAPESAADAKKRAQDDIQTLEAQWNQYKARLDSQRQIMESEKQIELEKAGQDAAAQLEIERRYASNFQVLKNEELKAQIAYKQKVDALNTDRGESAKLAGEVNAIEQQLVTTREVSARQAELLGLKEVAAARARALEFESVFEAAQRVRDQLALDDVDPAKIMARRAQLLSGTPTGETEAHAKAAQDAAAALDQQLITAQEYQEILAKGTAETNRLGSVTQQLGYTFSSAFEGAIVQGQTFGGVLSGLAQDIERIIIRMAVVEPIMAALFGDGKKGGDPGLLGGVLGVGKATAAQGAATAGFWGDIKSAAFGIGDFFGGFFAEGGDPPVGKPAIVGERGPEWFIPKVPGTVVPIRPGGGSSGAALSLAGGRTEVHIHDMRGAGAPPAQVERSQSGGVEQIRVLLLPELKRALNGGHLDTTLAANYGLNRVGFVR